MTRNEKRFLLYWLAVLALSMYMAIGCKTVKDSTTPDDFDTTFYFTGGCWVEVDSTWIKE